MHVSIEFAYSPDWTSHAHGLGFGPAGLLASTHVEIPEIDPESAPERYTVRDRDGRIHVLREHRGALYEPVPKVPMGLPLKDLAGMDFRPRKAWDGSWEMAFDKGLALARFETKRLECLQRATARNPTGMNPFLVASGDHREREGAARDAFREAGIALVGGQVSRRVPQPVLVLTSHRHGHADLCVSMRPATPAPGQRVFPLSAYDDAVEAVRALGAQPPAKPLVVEHDDPAPAPRMG